MAETVEITLSPSRRSVIPLILGAAISFLTVTALRTIASVTAWPLLQRPFVIYKVNVGSGLAAHLYAFAGFLGNALPIVVAFWFISLLARISHRDVPRVNPTVLGIARLVTIVAFLDLCFGFLRQQASNFVVVDIGNATHVRFDSELWELALGILFPLIFLLLILALAAKWNVRQTLSK